MSFFSRLFLGSCVVLATACGGKVTFVEGGGEGGAGSTSATGPSTTGGSTGSVSTGGTDCASLLDAMNAAVAAAQACDLSISSTQCDGTAILDDSCGCPSILLNEKNPGLVKAALGAYNAWTNAGCGPFGCGGACFPAVPGFCSANGNGTGTCAQALPD